MLSLAEKISLNNREKLLEFYNVDMMKNDIINSSQYKRFAEKILGFCNKI